MLSDSEIRRQQYEQRVVHVEQELKQRNQSTHAEMDQLRVQLVASLARSAELEEERRRLELESRENEREISLANASSYSSSSTGSGSKLRMVLTN